MNKGLRNKIIWGIEMLVGICLLALITHYAITDYALRLVVNFFAGMAWGSGFTLYAIHKDIF